MNKYQKFGLISGQVLMGLLFGFGGVIVTALLGTVYEELTRNYIGDLSTSLFYSLYGGYVGMQIGICFDGYKYLKGEGRLNLFKKCLGQSVVGFIVGLLMFYYFFSSGHINTFFEGLLAYLAPTMPMIGAIIGFDFGFAIKLNKKESKSI